MHVDSAPGPPRTSIVLAGGRRVAVLDIGLGHDSGRIDLDDRSRLSLERPPGSAEWWVTDADGNEVATLRRSAPLGERFAIRLGSDGAGRAPRASQDRIGPTELVVINSGGPWRRRWAVCDEQGRDLIEVVQRRCARPVHDLHVRAGDLPHRLPLLVAWLLASVSHPPLAATRRGRWTIEEP